MNPGGRVAGAFRATINLIHWTSPYRWFDEILKSSQMAARRDSADGVESRRELFWLRRRYILSDCYILSWLAASIIIYLLHPQLPRWMAVLIGLRCFGILNKELGVVLFGICKVTEGGDVSASGRVVTLALINYTSSLFCFAALHGMLGNIEVQSLVDGAVPIAPLLQSIQLHFALSPAFPPVSLTGYLLVAAQSIFVFFFATIIISLFVSLLERRSREDRGW